MKYIKFLTLFLAGILLFSTGANAEDDVMVDLSVLDSLGASVSPRVNSQPLFPPVVKKKISHKRHQPKKADKAKIIKVDSKKVVKNKKTPKELAVKDTPAKEVAEENINVTKPINVPVVNDSPEAKVAIAEPKITGAAPVAETQPEIISETKAEGKPAVEHSAQAREEVPSPQLLVTHDAVEEKQDIPTEPKELYFSDEDTLLTEKQKSQLDAISSSFGAESGKRIGIYAFNFDDGQDMFKKKRQCLNRALEVRAYLMEKGFRTFSVKVVNVTDDSSKKNKVIVEEIK